MMNSITAATITIAHVTHIRSFGCPVGTDGLYGGSSLVDFLQGVQAGASG